MKTTQDAFHNGAFHLLQANNGAHRAGMDALLLAACVPESGKSEDLRIADFGAGCGIVGFACANRLPSAKVDLFEIDEEIAELARQSAALPENHSMADQINVFNENITLKNIDKDAYHWVLGNPPFNDNHHRSSPNAQRRLAHDMDNNTLPDWVDAAAYALKMKDHLAFILRPSSLPEMLSALDREFGSIKIRPVITKLDQPASRMIIVARKGGRAGLQILREFVVHSRDGGFTPQADAIFKGTGGLEL